MRRHTLNRQEFAEPGRAAAVFEFMLTRKFMDHESRLDRQMGTADQGSPPEMLQDWLSV
jgi:hypothetical protein